MVKIQNVELEEDMIIFEDFEESDEEPQIFKPVVVQKFLPCKNIKIRDSPKKHKKT